MKKNVVLFILFIFPIVAYLFFASGVNSFSKLPVLTKNVSEFGTNWKSQNDSLVQLQGRITILGFSGNDVLSRKGNYFNLDQKIYRKYSGFKDFQIVILSPVGTEKAVDSIMDKLKTVSEMNHWHFVFAPVDEMDAFYKSLQLQEKLDIEIGTPNVYIIDKERNVRGRKGLNDKKEEEYKEGYNTSLVSELHNEMTDDVRIILAEYRLALKKNNASRKKSGL